MREEITEPVVVYIGDMGDWCIFMRLYLMSYFLP